MAKTKLGNKIATARWEAAHPKIVIRVTAEQSASLRRIADAAKLAPHIVAAKLIKFALQVLAKQRQLDGFEGELKPQARKKTRNIKVAM